MLAVQMGEEIFKKMNLMEYLVCVNILRGNLHTWKDVYVGISGR